MHKTTEPEIESFLKECREVINNSFFLCLNKNRPENKQTLIELGYNKQNVKDEIFSLSVKDYASGPKPDKTYLGEVWEFGIFINGREVYIKLEISRYNDPGDLITTLYCISFHFAKHKLYYPYKPKK